MVAAGDLGTIRWPDEEVKELGVKVDPERGRVGKCPPSVVALWSNPWKAQMELRFSMERQ